MHIYVVAIDFTYENITVKYQLNSNLTLTNLAIVLDPGSLNLTVCLKHQSENDACKIIISTTMVAIMYQAT